MNRVSLVFFVKIGFSLLSCLILFFGQVYITHSKAGLNSDKRFRGVILYRGLNFLYVIGLALINLKFPLWKSLTGYPVWMALLIDDCFNLLLIFAYFSYFLYQSFVIAKHFYHIQSSFLSYVSQYAFFWIIITNILVLLRVEYYYFPLFLPDLPSLTQIIVEFGFAVFIIVIQGIALIVRRLKMIPAGPELRKLIADVAQKMGVKIRQVKIWQLESVENAFATGIFRRSIFLTEAIANTTDKEDLEMIVGHECAHFKLRHLEIRIIFISGVVGLGSYFFESFPETPWLWMIIFGLISLFLYKFIARFQEYQADAFAAKILGSGERMAKALRNVFGFGINGTPSRFDWFLRKWLSHPDLESRVQRLSSKG